MHPILFHLGHLAFSSQAVLVVFGLLAGLQLSCVLAPRLGLAADRIWNLGLVSLLTLFVGERLLVIAFNLRDFIDHPVWMLGLSAVLDERYFYGGVLMAAGAGAGYIAAWRLPWLRVADCLVPGAGLALVCASLGSLAAGSDFGRPVSAAWGIIYSSRVAARTAGTPLGISLIPVMLYAALLHAVCAGAAAWLLLRGSRTGTAACLWLWSAGLGTVLLQQLRYSFAGEALIAGVFTPAQAVGVLAVALAALLWLWPPAGRVRTSTAAPAAPVPGQ